MSYFAKLRGRPAPAAAPLPPAREPGWLSRGTASGKIVTDSRDLRRIAELPRRPRPSADELAALSKKWTGLLGRGERACICESAFRRGCAKQALPVQAWALEEMSLMSGALDPIGVGDGKTLLDLLAALVVPGCRVAVLLLPPNLREQLLESDWEFYGQHWRLPNRAGGKFFVPGLPVLHVVAYSELSGARATELLETIRPDLIIADEAHCLRSRNAARTKRFRRYLEAHPEVRFCAWSGTLTSKGLGDYADLSRYALHEGSPAPLHHPTVEEWAGALDPSEMPSNPGALMRFAQAGEDVTRAYHRRLVETPGVVSSPDTGNCQASLVISERKVQAPQIVKDALAGLYRTWQRPDEEELVDALSVARCAREISSGFYYRWRWPRGEPIEVRQAWLAARKDWHKEQREKLKFSRAHLDSPLLLAKAAIRWHMGYTHITRDETGKELGREEIPPHTKNGPQATWDSQTWPLWEQLCDTAKPETEAVWIDDFLARDAASWAASGVGIVWYEHACFGAAVSQFGNIPLFGPGEEASRGLLGERGARSVVASIRAHGTGKNLQPFSRNLVANPPADGAAWEQLIGRTHRTGQLADEVTVEVYRHLPPMIEAFDKARTLARYIQGTLGGAQKLLRGTILF